MLINEIIQESSRAPLYRGISDLRFVDEAIAEDRIVATGWQRMWVDGKRRKDNDPEYDGSQWLLGVSASRDLDFAMSWGRAAVFRLNADYLKMQYRIIPYNWAYSIPNDDLPHKREREEFVVTRSSVDTVRSKKTSDEYAKQGGEIKPLARILTGIYLNINEIINFPPLTSADQIIFDKISQHPLFLGYYQGSNRDHQTKFYGKEFPSSLLPHQPA